MTPAQATAMYRRKMRPFETVVIRQYQGTGASREKFDWTVMARVVGYEASELIGSVVQGDSHGIILHEDLVAAGFPSPFNTKNVTGDNWRIVVGGQELRIKKVDDRTRKLGDHIIAYDVQIGGA